MTAWPYDLTAEFYDIDMGRNTDERDVAWYVAEASRAVAALGGPVLEWGCGTGRVTLALAAAGIEVIAADLSPPMLGVLVRKAAAAGLAERIRPLVADMARPACAHPVAAILCPYSAFGYLVDPDDRARMLAGAHAGLLPGGRLLLDMYVPDDALPEDTEIVDYVRELPADGRWAPAVRLARSKWLARDTRTGINRIDRHYRFLAADGGLVREVRTTSLQRPYPPEALRRVLAEAGFEVTLVPDFDPAHPPATRARATAVVAHRRCD